MWAHLAPRGGLASATLIALVSLTLTAPPLQAQPAAPVVKGTVVDSANDPLGGVHVSVLDTYWTTSTDRRGRFRLRLPAGRWQLRFRHVGFAAETLAVEVPAPGAEAGAELPTLRVRLEAEPVQLKGLSVEASAGPDGRGWSTTPTA